MTDDLTPAHKVRFTSGGNEELRERMLLGDESARAELERRASPDFKILPPSERPPL